MYDSLEIEFEAEDQQYQQHLAQIRDMDPADADAALAAEKRRHLWAILGAWQRHKPLNNNHSHARAM